MEHRNNMQDIHVAVVGGGIAGMTAAHELAERGFKVTLYDNKSELGGKARSFYLTDDATSKTYAAEHGFRFFLRWYENLHHTLQRIPVDDPQHVGAPQHVNAPQRTVFEHLTAVDELTIGDYTFSFVKPEPIPIRPPVAWIKAMSSCKPRHEQELGDLNWDDYINESLRDEPEDVVHFFKNVAKATASVHSTEVCVRGMSYTLNRLLINPGLDILNGPTNDTWFDHWERYLRHLGVTIHQESTLTAIHHHGEEITGLEFQQRGRTFPQEADYYVLAIPHHNLEALLPADLMAKDTMLQKLPQLQSEWQAGLQFYLKNPINMPRGHLGFPRAPWALSCILQTDFWDTTTYKSDAYGAILSLIIANWDEPGVKIEKPAKQCTKAELIEEIKAQLNVFAPEMYETVFAEMEVLHCEIDPGIRLTGDETARNETPLFMNKVRSWHSRPANKTATTNMYLAGDFTRTSAYLATMESANESGRRATNALLKDVDYAGELCSIHTRKHERTAKVLQPLVQIDEVLHANGQPHMFDLVEPELVEELIDKLTPFMQFEGSLLDAFDEVYDASMKLLRDFISKNPSFDISSLLLEGNERGPSRQVSKEQLASRIQGWARVDMTMADKMPLSFPSNLSSYLNTDDPIFSPLLYTTKSKGSGHRVKFALAVNTWLDVATDRMAHLLETGQCIHNCSLLIDDIMDDTEVRREQASAHVRYGINQTLGSAYTSFLQILLSAYINLGEGCLLAYLEEGARAHVGQSHDVHFRETQECPTEEAYLEMIVNKTGSFFRVFVACMLHLGPREHSRKLVDTLMRFTDNIGRFFQIRDDYLDLVSEEYFIKKGSVASDFDEGKFSYPVVHCIQTCPETHGAFMEVFNKPNKTESDKMRLLALLEKHGSLGHTLSTLEELYVEVMDDLHWLEREFGRENKAMREWVGELAQGTPGLSVPSMIGQTIPTRAEAYKDPFGFSALPLDTMKRALRNVFCAYHVYYEGNGWSQDDFWQCFPLLLTVETMVFNVDDENELSAQRDAPVITRESVEQSKIWQLIRSSGFYTDEMTTIYDQALQYYKHEFEWYKGTVGDVAVLEKMNHLKSTNFRIMHILAANVLDDSGPPTSYAGLEDYVSSRIELEESRNDAEGGVYNVFTHCSQLFPHDPERAYADYVDALATELSTAQMDMAAKWLRIYKKGSEVPTDDTSVEVSFQRVYATGRDIANICMGDPALADFTLAGNFKWCIDRFTQENKNPLSSDAVFRKLQNNVLARMSGLSSAPRRHVSHETSMARGRNEETSSGREFQQAS